MREIRVALTSILALLLASSAFAVEERSSPIPAPAPGVSEEADQALRRMSAYLAAAKSLSYEAEVTYDVVLGDGQKIQNGSVTKAAWRRPGELLVETDGNEHRRLITIADGSFTFADLDAGVFATSEVPEDLDAALDEIFERLDISVPLSDFVYSDPYAALVETATQGRRVGVNDVRGVPCLHLAFTAPGLDWQIWIEEGERPLPRKLVIDYKDLLGSPGYSAILTDWKLDAKLEEGFAKFTASESVGKTEFLKADGPIEEEQ